MTSFKKLMTKQEEKLFILDCIHLYRDLPVLWNLKSKDYYNRDKKNMAYDILLNKYRETYPEATKEDVKRKFNSLRTNYRKELKKQLKSLESSEKNSYEPTLWYYNELKFLEDQESITESDHQFVDVDKEDTADPKMITIIDENAHQPSTLKYPPPPTNVTTASVKQVNNNLKKEENNENTSSSSYDIRKRLREDITEQDILNKRAKPQSGEHNHWALACAADLQKMDPVQEILAKRAIAEILMEGRLGLLRHDSVYMNSSPENILSR